MVGRTSFERAVTPTFTTLLLNAEDVEARWQEVLDDLIHSPKWDDGVSFESGHDSDAGGPGSYNYIKLSKK